MLVQYLLRDILQFEGSLHGAMSRIASARRTCDLILGVGDGKVRCDARVHVEIRIGSLHVDRSTSFVV